MLRPQIGQSTDSLLFTFLLTVGRRRSVTITIQSRVNSAIRSFHKALVFLIALQNSHGKVLAVRCHLGNVDDRKLECEKNFSGPLQSQVSIYLPVLLRNPKRGKRSVFKLNV